VTGSTGHVAAEALTAIAIHHRRCTHSARAEHPVLEKKETTIISWESEKKMKELEEETRGKNRGQHKGG